MQREELIGVVARICHEANRAWCEHWGDHSQRPWAEAHQWQRDSAIDGVRYIFGIYQSGGTLTAKQLHENWMQHKLATGWKWGKVKNQEAKEHHLLIPYEELNPKERLKDQLFLGIVKAFLK